MLGSSHTNWAEESWLVGNGLRSMSRRALLDFIHFPLCCIDPFQMLSFVRRGRRVAGVELSHLAGQPGGGGYLEAVIL